MSMCTPIVPIAPRICCLSRPAHAHVSLPINYLQSLLHRLRFLARTFALLLGSRCIDGRHRSRCSRRLRADVVEVPFAWG